MDDGSTDGTEAYLKALSDPRVFYIRNNTSIGASAARNKAIKTLDTDLVTGLDDDDIFLPNRLETLLNVYDERFAFVCSGYLWDYGVHKKPLFTNNKVISLSNALDLNECSNQILVKRERALAVGGFDPSLPALQDHDMWVRLIERFGDAYRIGKALYVVNDDKSLERISSVQNKLNAIDLFAEKHKDVMNRRNIENFAFYRKKIKGEKISLPELLNSTKYGQLRLKLRHAVAQKLERLSKERLQYMSNGHVSNPILNWILSVFVPLVATGGPGASRVILLSSCIFFLGASNTANFGSDFFILMLINTAFSQSFGFFALKEDYQDSYSTLLRQSMWGLFCAIILIFLLFLIEVVSNLLFTIPILVFLHFYYVYRYKRISQQSFFVLAIAESIISLVCLILPFTLALMNTNSEFAPYLIYTIALVLGFISVFSLGAQNYSTEIKKVPLKNVVNIGISTSAGIFAVFCFPYISKQVFDATTASYVALAISCFSIAILIPRTYANKVLKNMASKQICYNQLANIAKRYSKLIWLSCSVGWFATMTYLLLMGVNLSQSMIIPLLIMSIFVCAQHGFVNLTSLSLHGEEWHVAKLNLMVLILTLSVLALLVTNTISQSQFIYILPVLCCTFVLRNLLAKKASINKFRFDT